MTLAAMLSELECVDAAIAGHVKPIPSDNERLEMVQAAHRFIVAAAGEDRLSGISAIPVQAIVTVAADDPDDGIRAPVRGGHDWRSPAAYRCAPNCRERRRIAWPNLERHQVSSASRTIRTLALERDEDAVRRGIGDRGGDDRTRCDGLDRESAANAPEMAPIKQVGAPVLAQRQHESLRCVGTRHIQK